MRLFFIFILFNLINSQSVRIGSKEFPESRLLAEMISILIEENTEYSVERKFGLGGTLIVFEAIKNNEIDIYPEYTGTGLTAILKSKYNHQSSDSIFNYLNQNFKRYSIQWMKPIGFNNTYALAIHDNYKIKKISELGELENLKVAFTHEFINREDGYLGLSKHYNLNFNKLKGMEHGLSYAAIENRKIDLTDAYSTDGKLKKYQVHLLEDDLNFFPSYQAAYLVRSEILFRNKELSSLIEKIHIKQDEMIALNFKVEVEREGYYKVAREFLKEKGLVKEENKKEQSNPLFVKLNEHLVLTITALFFAVIVSVPIALFVIKRKKLANFFLNTSSIIQTIPSLAMLGFLIPLFGIGKVPAIIALTLYAILPILRNTYSGILSVNQEIVEASIGLGLNNFQVLKHIKIPLAMPIIIAGVRTSAVITVGTATLAAFIGAGGLGDFIITGISLNDHELILKGAIPAAVLAIFFELFFTGVEKLLIPKKN